MNQLKKTILLIMLLPIVGAFIVYQIDPGLLDPESEDSLFGLLSMASEAADLTGQLNLTGADSPTQILGMLFTSLGSDSLKAGTGKRDPMVPLVSLNQSSYRPVRRAAPVRQPKFPIKGTDINAIFYRSAGAQVLIRGGRYRVGDQIQGAEITEINQSSVVFFWRNKSYTVEKARRGLNVQ